jgi:hypothetical protein
MKFLKVLAYAVFGLAVVLGAAVLYLANRRPAQRAALAVTIAKTPDRVARGEYLVKHVVICTECHAEHVRDRYGFPLVPGAPLKGQVILTKNDQFPGTLAAHNLTPDPETGLGRWTDGEVLRAMREGVDRDGRALFPMMPYENFRDLSDADAEAVVAYLRTLSPVPNAVPARKLDFPLPLIVPGIPKPLAGPVGAPDPKDEVAYGRYLATVAGCKFCHTPVNERMQPLPGKDFAGGHEFHLPGGGARVRTANLTPDPDTYMGKATKEEFIGRFRAFASLNAETSPVAPKGRNTAMPWLAFSGMTDQDLSALYAFLKTVPPVKNKVESFPDAPGPAPAMPGVPAAAGSATSAP